MISRGRRWSASALLALGMAAPVTAGPNQAEEFTFTRSRHVDPAGLSFLRNTRQRSPEGFLYPYPYAPPERLGLGDGWIVGGFGEVGWMESSGGDDEAYLERYSDYRDGIVDALRLEARNAPSGFYVELGANALGRDDASAFLDFGQRGRLRVRGSYDKLPHRYANDARVLFDGAGSESLTLPAGLVAGGSSDAAIDAAIAARPESRVAFTREKGGVELAFAASDALSVNAGYRVEDRSGERPFGGAIRFAFQAPTIGSVIETLEPLDSRTHDVHGAIAVSDPHIQIDVGYDGSFFENRVESLTWENPFSDSGVDRGRFALTPDNALHRIHATGGFALPWRGRWTNTFSMAQGRQDERLLAPTINPTFAAWTNPATSLSRSRADASVDTMVVTSTLKLVPLRFWNVGGKFRLEQRKSETDYVAFNPSTGGYGYIAEDGSFGIQPRYAAVPYDADRVIFGADTTWRLPVRSRLTIEYEREQVERDQRARAETRDDRGRISVSTRGIPRTRVRLAYELSDRGGSSYRPDRDAEFYSTGPPGFAAPFLGSPQRSLLGFEQFDLSDRVRHDGQARVSFGIAEIADLAFNGGVKDDDYDARYGLRRSRAWDANAELSIQPAPQFDAFVFGSLERRKRALDTIYPASSTGTQFEPGGPVFPFDRAWDARTRAESVAAGAGFTARPVERLELRLQYQLLVAEERLSYGFASASALAPGTTAADAGARFPTLRNTDHILDTSARFQVTDWVALRFAYRYWHSTIANFHQAGLVPRIGHAIYLGHVDGDFAAHWLGGSVEIDL